MKKIVVVGSINMDLVVNMESFLQAGETKQAISVNYFSGGKGANQAVAAAKSGADVLMVGAVGTDSFASTLLNDLKHNGVNIDGVMQLEGNCGLAIITVASDGENQIMLDAGTNTAFSGEQAVAQFSWDECALIILQNEINFATTQFLIEEASKRQIPVWFNPAPAIKLPSEILPHVDLLILNETEVEFLTGLSVTNIEEVKMAIQQLQKDGANDVLVTLGENGCLYSDRDGNLTSGQAFKVEAKDTTAAGDTFIGSLANAIVVKQNTLQEALRYASAASALAVMKSGAQQSIPTNDEIERFLEKTK